MVDTSDKGLILFSFGTIANTSLMPLELKVGSWGSPAPLASIPPVPFRTLFSKPSRNSLTTPSYGASKARCRLVSINKSISRLSNGCLNGIFYVSHTQTCHQSHIPFRFSQPEDETLHHSRRLQQSPGDNRSRSPYAPHAALR